MLTRSESDHLTRSESDHLILSESDHVSLLVISFEYEILVDKCGLIVHCITFDMLSKLVCLFVHVRITRDLFYTM